jgi:hypothetical protein
MTSLSRAAQAVMDATDYPEDLATRIRVAAALQAAADQVVPFSGSRKNNEIRFELLAIAAELEGQ